MACSFCPFPPQYLVVLSIAGACLPPPQEADVQAGGSRMVPWPGWVQKRKLSLNNVFIASYLPSERVCVLVSTSPNACLSHV